MHKNFTSLLLVTTLLLSSTGVYSDDQTTPPVQAEPREAPAATNTATTDNDSTMAAEPREVPAATNTATTDEDSTMAAEPREVGAASHDAAKAARARRWQNIGIAGLAVAVAATAIYLASTNGGHHAKQ